MSTSQNLKVNWKERANANDHCRRSGVRVSGEGEVSLAVELAGTQASRRRVGM
jgi:hypothetical protein